MLIQCYFYLSLYLSFLISNCFAKNSLKKHKVTKEYDITKGFKNIRKVDRDYRLEVDGLEERATYSDFYQNLIFYDDQREYLSPAWKIYAKTRGTKVYTVNNSRKSNICNLMRNEYDIPLVIEFVESGLISFQYSSYLDIDKMDSFMTYISHLHSKYTISVAYLSKKYEYSEIEMKPDLNITYNRHTNWRKIKYSLKSPLYKHQYKYLLIRNNGPRNTIYIGRSLFLPDDIIFYSDQNGVNTDFMYLTGYDLTNINRNGYFSITSLTSTLEFSLLFNNNNDKPITNLNNFDGLSFFLIKSSPTSVEFEFTINTSIGDYSTAHVLSIDKSVISIMLDFRNFQGYSFLLADTTSITFTFHSKDPNCIFRIREIIGHIKYPNERRFDIVFNRYLNKTVEPSYFEIYDKNKYIKNQCLTMIGHDPLANKRNLNKSIVIASICCVFILIINIIFLFTFKVFHYDEQKEKTY